MFRNYLKASYRNLMKNKMFSSINIAGLSIGMAACLLILQYVSFELSYDQFNTHAPDLYRVSNDRYQNGKLIQHGTITYSGVGKAMKDDFPEVAEHARVMPRGYCIITYDSNRKIGEQQGIYVDNSFLSMFSYPLLAGDRGTALKEPNTVILTRKLAGNMYGVTGNDFQSVIGKTIVVQQDSTPYKITGVSEDVPENSHLSFDLLLSYSTVYTGSAAYKEADYDFTQSDFWHYIQLKKGTDHQTVEAKLPAFSQRHFQGNKVSGNDEKFYLQPLSKAHLYSDFEYEIGNTGSATVVWGLLIIAVLIIVIAWVNYINLSTAKSMERAKEVGIRKVAGATRQQLIRQFLTESVLINIIAVVISLIIVSLVQPAFNRMVEHELSLSYLFTKGLNGYAIITSLILLLILGMLVSGFYPALVLSSFRPILVLKGKFTGSVKGSFLRKGLVVGQFAITVALIIGSFVVYRQMQYISKQNLGMDISQVLIVRPPLLSNWDSGFIDRSNTFTTELKKIPGVAAAASSRNVIGGETGRSFNIRRFDQDETTKYTMRHTSIGIGYIDLYGLRLLAGRGYTHTDFNPDFNKLRNIIVNESAVKLLGFASPAEAIGKVILRYSKEWEIIGVINDYNQKSLRYAVEPTLLMPAYSTNNSISVKVDTKDLTGTLASIKKQFDTFFPGNLFDYFFLNERFNDQYKNEQLFGKVFSIFSCIAIFIACLGLLGLSLFATSQRTKEIGVRKVLGASVLNIVTLLSRDFIKLIILAFLIASPLAWLVMHKWLQDFAYRTNISWWIFAVAGMLAIVIALVTISFQAVKAALANPVKSLRTE